MSPKDGYRYTPLPPDHIRILRILPFDDRHGRVQCISKVIGLEDPDRYIFRAMSYVWGNPTMDKPICIDGKAALTTQSVIDLVSQLRVNLKRQGATVSDEWLWIDAISINQKDPVERASQVSLMGKIYQWANAVHIWLGKATIDSGLAIDLIRKLKIELPYIRSAKEIEAGLSGERPLAQDPSWLALGKLLSHPWFTRIWVVQEVVLATHPVSFMCGAKWFEWEDFESLMDHLSRLRLLSRTSTAVFGGSSPAQTYYIRVQKAQNWLKRDKLDLTSALQLVGFSFQATNPKDQIYGLYGMASGIGSAVLAPDYGKPVESIYTDTTRYLYFKKNCLDLLENAGIAQQGNPKLPTWVPDFNTLQKGASLERWAPHIYVYNASGSWKADVDFDSQSNAMVVYATVIGSVQMLGDHITSIGSMEELRVRIRNAFGFVKQYNSGRGHAGLVEADVWRTLIGNISHLGKDGIPTSPDSSSKTLLRYQKTLPILKDWINGPEDTEAKWLRQLIFSSGKRTSEEYDTWDCAQVILDTIWTLAERRSFGVAAGCAGLFPAMATAGDEVAVVKGLSVPLVIRRCGGGQARSSVKHAVVGACYVHGYMDGERMAGLSLGRITLV